MDRPNRQVFTSPFLPEGNDPLSGGEQPSAKSATPAGVRRFAPRQGQNRATNGGPSRFDPPPPRGEKAVKLGLASITGGSDALREAIDRARKVATSRLTTVLLL